MCLSVHVCLSHFLTSNSLFSPRRPPPAPSLVSQVERIFEAIDVDKSGEISITEFVAASLAKRQINTRAIKAAFSRLDYGR